MKSGNRRMDSRNRPFHSCAVSIFAIADIACRRALNFNGPSESTWRRMARFASPLIYAMQYQGLAILSFLDDRILVAEKMIEKLFPSSAFVFDKIDDLVLTMMSLPEIFDNVLFIEWALVHMILCLNYLISRLNNLGQKNSRIEEITIDISRICNKKLESLVPMDSNESEESFAPTSEASEAENRGVDRAVSSKKKGSYKEALEKGKEENPENVGENENIEELQSQKVDGGENENIEEELQIQKVDGGENENIEKEFKSQKVEAGEREVNKGRKRTKVKRMKISMRNNTKMEDGI